MIILWREFQMQAVLMEARQGRFEERITMYYGVNPIVNTL